MVFTVGLVGLGKIGALYDVNSSNTMSHLNAVAKDHRFSLSFACDPNDKACTFVRAYYGIKNVFNNISDVPKDHLEIDLLVVASPTIFHLESIELMLNRFTPKIVLCEKPLAENLTESHKLAEICRLKNVTLITNYMRRSLPLFRELKGKITTQFPSEYDVVVKYSGCFQNNGSHFVDLMDYFYGPPEKLIWSLVEKEIDSSFKVRAIVSHKYATCTYVPLSSTSVVEHEVEIMSDAFKLVIGSAGRDIKVYEVSEDTDFSHVLMYSNVTCLTSDYVNFQKYVYNDIFLALSSGVSPSNLCDIQSSINNVRFIQELT